MCEAFVMCYATQAGVLGRAQVSQPVLHGFAGVCCILCSVGLSFFYAVTRFNGSIKVFELPCMDEKARV